MKMGKGNECNPISRIDSCEGILSAIVIATVIFVGHIKLGGMSGNARSCLFLPLAGGRS
jgi:hypothetical protein